MRLLLAAILVIFSSVAWGQTPPVGDINSFAIPPGAIVPSGLNNNSNGAGTFDNSGPINAALALTGPSGSRYNIYLPAGRYHVSHAIATVGQTAQPSFSQCLIGDGWGTIIDVDSDFDPTANGVINLMSQNTSISEPCVRDLQVFFHIPKDIQSTANVQSLTGSTSITVNALSGGTIAIGMYVYDFTFPASIPNANGNVPTTVTSVTDNGDGSFTVGITPALVGNVNVGHSIQFGQPRAGFATLAAGCNTATPGGTPCKYPWAIWDGTLNAGNVYLDHLLVTNAWDGIHHRGGTFHFGTIFMSAFDIGLDIDNCHNFPQIDDYEFWNFGIGNGVPNTQALGNTFYDGTTIAANIGATDGLGVGNFQVWTGIVNLTSAFTWGTFANLSMDGNNSNLFIGSGGAGVSWLQIANFYSTKGIHTTAFPAITVNASISSRMMISNPYIAILAQPALAMQQGDLTLVSGRLLHTDTTTPAIVETGGQLKIFNMKLESEGAPASNRVFIQETNGILQMCGNTFATVATTNPVGVSMAVDNGNHMICNNNVWTGWTLTAPFGTFGGGWNGMYVGSRPQSTRTVTGTTDNQLATDKIISFNSSTGGVAEAMRGCGNGNSGTVITFYDKRGDSSTNPDTLTPSGGTIQGVSSYIFAANGQSRTFACDGPNTNWVLQ